VSVRTREMEAPTAEQAQSTRRPSLIVPGIMALLFGVPIWVIGARYTLDGWVIVLNLIAGVTHLPFVLTAPAGMWSLLLFPIGIGYSLIEVRYRPRGARTFAPWLVWALVIVSDYGSTYIAATTPPADAWAITAWMATTVPAAALWTAVLTFLPETLIMAGIRWIAR
jgi:hypothetical protein